MTQHAPVHLSSEDVLAISDALVAVEQHLLRYHGRRVQLDAEPFKADFAPDFKRLLRAKRLLSRNLSDDDRKEIVSALEYAHIAIALHDGNSLVDRVPAAKMDFGNAMQLVLAALAILQF